jgi:hypothetical protein
MGVPTFSEVKENRLVRKCNAPHKTISKIMNDAFPSLITSDAKAGMELAGRLAHQLHSQIEEASCKVERPGGMNYLLPAQVPKEITTGILFYAISVVNRGWPITVLTSG